MGLLLPRNLTNVNRPYYPIPGICCFSQLSHLQCFHESLSLSKPWEGKRICDQFLSFEIWPLGSCGWGWVTWRDNTLITVHTPAFPPLYTTGTLPNSSFFSGTLDAYTELVKQEGVCELCLCQHQWHNNTTKMFSTQGQSLSSYYLVAQAMTYCSCFFWFLVEKLFFFSPVFSK